MTRVGLELELLAPDGKTRDDLARALAKQAGGALRLGLKYHGAGHFPDGRPDARLTPASRVDVRGKWLASFVDDPTIEDDLPPTSERRRIARTDDVRLAAWIERSCWHAKPTHRFAALTKTFHTTETDEGLLDPWGHPLVLWADEPLQRARVCEVVLRPLEPKERKPVLTRVMKLATSLGFTVPQEAAVHAHFDAAPFRSTALLRRLVLTWTHERAAWRTRFEPNPRCRKLGPFPADVVRVAEVATDDLPFETVAAGYLLGGLHRAVDLNLLGLVEQHPKQPTVELRCLPGSLDAEATLSRLAQADAFLARVQRG